MTLATKERGWIWLLCGLAVLRVFVYSAAFPFFNNVDEYMHFDAIVKYARGQYPPGTNRISAATAEYITRYSSPEYFSDVTEETPPPVWTQQQDKIRHSLQIEMQDWETKTNHEYSSPPLYYAVAGTWMNLGRAGGLQGIHLLYWIRFLNLLPAGLLVWLGFLAARAVFPQNRFVYLGTPALLAAWPQDFFYAIQSDILSPICFGAGFVGLVFWMKSKTPDLKLAAFTGLALITGSFVKTSNAPLFAVGAVMFLFQAWKLAKSGENKSVWPCVGLFVFCALVPLVMLCAWNLRTNGDIGGATMKVQALGWTRKPLSEWWSHPIFTPGGLATFWWGFTLTFWRGELIWHSVPITRPAVDAFYCFSSIALLLLAAGSVTIGRASLTKEQRRVAGWSFACVAAAIAFLMFLSIIFDFGDCIYPSRGYPYFVSGRLVSGVMIPFALLYVLGIDWALSKQNARAKWMALSGIILMMSISEVIVTKPVFASAYNWFHL